VWVILFTLGWVGMRYINQWQGRRVEVLQREVIQMHPNRQVLANLVMRIAQVAEKENSLVLADLLKKNKLEINQNRE